MLPMHVFNYPYMHCSIETIWLLQLSDNATCCLSLTCNVQMRQFDHCSYLTITMITAMLLHACYTCIVKFKQSAYHSYLTILIDILSMVENIPGHSNIQTMWLLQIFDNINVCCHAALGLLPCYPCMYSTIHTCIVTQK